MSWTASLANAPRDNVVEALEENLQNQLKSQPFDEWDPDVKEQQDIALAAVQECADQVRGDRLNVSMGGHRVAEGQQGTDTFSVSISSSAYVSPALSEGEAPA